MIPTRRRRREHPPLSWRQDLAVRIERLRHRAGLTQSALASHAGLSRDFIARLERGANQPGAYSVMRLAFALGVTADYLLGLVDHPRGHAPCNGN